MSRYTDSPDSSLRDESVQNTPYTTLTAFSPDDGNRLGDTQVSNTSSIYKFGDVGGGGLEARREYDAAMTQAIERSGRDLGWLFGTPQSSKQRLKYWDWGIGFSCRFQDLGCVFLAVLVGQLPPPTVNCEKEFEETHHFAHRPSGWVDCVEEFAKPSDPSN
ncbi:hypothetical protein DL95DRAFT_412904 [Leptodontidium sp. 2 PMI_412]|nr:hypothetical protein DL95DRAFT_412904 [Leptodontidium sp. 2 PMI_412]